MKLLSSFLVLFLISANSFGQTDSQRTWQYQSYPDLPFKLEHLVLNLTVEPTSSLIKGVGRYDLVSRRPDLKQIVLQTSDLEIQNINRGEQSLDFLVSGDSLIINLSDTLSLNEKTQLHITWQSDSKFGVHTDVYGNMWTSLNPGTAHHWFPVFDHPQVEAVVDAYFYLPAQLEVVFNGKLVKDEILSTEKRKVHWQTETPVAVTGLSLAVGNFTKDEALSGVKKITLFTPESLLLEEVRTGLLQIAVNSVKEIERNLSHEFPFESLNIVVLPDHKWEEKQSGAGVIYLYQNLGSLATQLKRGIAGQWFGGLHRYRNAITNASDYEFLKLVLLEDMELTTLANPDSLQTISAWNYWQSRYKNIGDAFFKKTIEQSIPELVKSNSDVTSWDDYAEYWYQQNGKYWDDLPEVSLNKKDAEKEYIYDVNYHYDEINSTLQLIFTAKREAVESLVDVQLTEFSLGDTSSSNFSFTGVQDTIEAQLSPGVEYVTLSYIGNGLINFQEKKPFPFLLNQLRSTNPKLRADAAIGLRAYTDRTDLQLALQDVLNREQEPEVRAQILKTLALILKGATGTEQIFLKALNSKEQPIQLAAVHALSNYPGNENVIYSLRNILLRSTRDTVFTASLQSYVKVSGADELNSLARRFFQQDSSQIKTLRVLEIAAKNDTTGQIIQLAEQLVDDEHPYQIRKKALELLIEHHQKIENREQLLSDLMDDRDPRIRFLALGIIEKLPEVERQQILTNRASEEYDPRILEKIRKKL